MSHTGTSMKQVDMKLEVDIIPVADIERSKQFYGRLGWRLDADDAPVNGVRIVQFTPPGSACSVTFGKGITAAAPGSAAGALIVSDIEAAYDEFARRGIDASEMWHGASFPPEARLSGPDPKRTSYGSFFFLQGSGRQRVVGPGSHDAAPRTSLMPHSHPRLTWQMRSMLPGGIPRARAAPCINCNRHAHV